MKLHTLLTAGALALGLAFSGFASAAAVNITPKLESITVKHGGKMVKIMRNQDQKNTVKKPSVKSRCSTTSSACRPTTASW